MKLFSKIVFICNIGFIVFIILGYLELNNKKTKAGDNIIPLPFITGTLVILGQFAIFLNLIFCLAVLALLLSKRMKPIPQWLLIANFTFLLIQVYYFFIY